MFSFGFQKAFQHEYQVDDDIFFNRVSVLVVHVASAEMNAVPASFKCYESAKAIVTVLVDSLVPTGYIRFAPDCAFTALCFAPVCRNFVLSSLFRICRVRLSLHAQGEFLWLPISA